MTTAMTTQAPNRIVVGVDGSEPSRNALKWAAFIAGPTGASIDAIAVWQMSKAAAGPGWADVPVEWDKTKETSADLASTLQEVFGEDLPTTLNAIVHEGNPAKVLLDASVGARMLVVGSRGHGGFVGLLLGSVSATCSAHASCPVLVVHGDISATPVVA